MAQQCNWEADTMLDVYIFDYFLRRNFLALANEFEREANISADLGYVMLEDYLARRRDSANAFTTEAKVPTDQAEIHSPGGFLFEWWSVFRNIFLRRANNKYSENAAAYIQALKKKRNQAQQMNAWDLVQQGQLMQQWQQHAPLQQRDANHPSLGVPINATPSGVMFRQPPSSDLAAKVYQDYMKPPHPMESVPSPHLLDANRNVLPNSATNYPSRSVQVNRGQGSAAFQQVQSWTQQITDIKGDVNLEVNRQSLPMDPPLIYRQGIMQSKSIPGLNQGAGGLPQKGPPLNMQMDQMQQVSATQLQDQTPKSQKGIKRKEHSSPVAARSPGNSGNTVGSFNSQTSSPSTRKPG